MDVRSDQRSSRHENNSQRQYLNISNIVQGGGHIYEPENIAIGTINNRIWTEHRKVVVQEGKTQEGNVEHGTEQEKNKNRNLNWTKT